MIRLLSKDEVLQHFLKLSPDDRYSRFCCQATDVYIRKYVDNAEGFFYGELKAPDSIFKKWEAVSVLHLVYSKKSNTVEIAISVLSNKKGQKLGKRLMYFALGVAEMYKAKAITINGLSSNSPMVKLAKGCGYDVVSQCGEFEGEYKTIGSDIDDIVKNSANLFSILLGAVYVD